MQFVGGRIEIWNVSKRVDRGHHIILLFRKSTGIQVVSASAVAAVAEPPLREIEQCSRNIGEGGVEAESCEELARQADARTEVEVISTGTFAATGTSTSSSDVTSIALRRQILTFEGAHAHRRLPQEFGPVTRGDNDGYAVASPHQYHSSQWS